MKRRSLFKGALAALVLPAVLRVSRVDPVSPLSLMDIVAEWNAAMNEYVEAHMATLHNENPLLRLAARAKLVK